MKLVLAFMLALQVQTPLDRIKQQRDDLTWLIDQMEHPPTPTPIPSMMTPVTCATLQAAIDTVKAGAVLALPPSASCGPITLKGTVGATLTTASGVPVPGTRATKDNATIFAKLNANSDTPAIACGDGVSGWTLIGLEIVGNPASNNNTIGLNGTCKDIVLDRLFIHGDPVLGAKNGVVMNAGRTILMNSSVVDFKRQGQDTQAVAGTQGPGPYTITNNLLEAAGEVILFGGDDPRIPNLIPSDIIISGNVIRRPIEWRALPTQWTVKNLLELKNARNVLIENNVFENHWVQAQSGAAIVFTVRNQDGMCPWCTVQNVTFQKNILRNVASAFNLLGLDDIRESYAGRPVPIGQTRPSVRMTNVKILQNTVDIDACALGGNGRTFQINGPQALEIRGNTVSGTCIAAAFSMTGLKTDGLVVGPGDTFQEGEYGIVGDGTTIGEPSLAAFAPGYAWSGVTIVKWPNGRSIPYPTGTTVVQP
jgi:hypothetical protein